MVRGLLHLHLDEVGQEGDKDGSQHKRLKHRSEGVDIDGVVVEVQPGCLLQALREGGVSKEIFEGGEDVSQVHNEALVTCETCGGK